MIMLRTLTLCLALAAGAATPVLAQADSASRDWNRPVAPFRIAGNLYYVGAKDVSSFLLTSDSGHILVDAGFAETAPQILANIERLGFRPRDVKVLLSSHGHQDHAGGFAALKTATGAPLVAAPGDADLIERGGRGDFAWGDRLTYPAAAVDRRILDGDSVRAGPLVMHAIATPGHTRGCTTWTTTVREGSRDLLVAIVCSLSAPGYHLAGDSAVPGLAGTYARTFRRLQELRPDIFLSSHGSAFDLLGKIARRGDGLPNPFIDPAEFPAVLRRAEQSIEAQRARQGAARRAEAPHGCVRGRPEPICSWFPLIEVGVHQRFTDRVPDDENTMFAWTLGFMKNTGERTAFGGQVFAAIEGEGRLGVALRARRWIHGETSIDIAGGMHIAGDASSGTIQAGSPMVQVRVNAGDWIAGTARFDLLRITNGCNFTSCGVRRTSPRFYVGAELGSWPGLVGFAATGALVVVALIVMSDPNY